MIEKDGSNFRLAWIRFVASNQAAVQVFGELAQLGERLVCNQEVTGSSPVGSTTTSEMSSGGKSIAHPSD